MAEQDRTGRLPRAVRVFWVGSVVAFALMFVVMGVERLLGFPPTYWHFLGTRFTDLLEFVPTYRLLHTEAFFHNPVTSSVSYPPFGAVLFGLIYGTGVPVPFYLTAAVVGLAAAVWGMRSALARRGVSAGVAVLVVSFPLLVLLQSGNLELFVWLFVAGGAWFFWRGNDVAAAVLWGLAGATKLYPVIFLALLLPRWRWRALAAGVATFVGTWVTSLWFLGPSIAVAWYWSLRNLFGYQGRRVGEWDLHELAANHSAFGLAKVAAAVVGLPLTKLTLPYYALGAVVFAVVFFGRLRKLPVANQLLGVTVFMLMFPPVSYPYTLMHLYAPWAVLLLLEADAERAGEAVPGLKAALAVFLPLFGSFTLFTFPRLLLFGGLVQAALLVVMFAASACFPFGLDGRGGVGTVESDKPV